MATPALNPKSFFNFDPKDWASLLQNFDPAKEGQPPAGQEQPAEAPKIDAAAAPMAANSPAPAGPGITAPAAATAQPPQQQPSYTGPMTRDSFFGNPQNDSRAQAYMPARPVSGLDNVHGWRRGLAMTLAGLGAFGGNLIHNPNAGEQLNQWTQQGLAQRDYDARAPQLKAQAQNQAYNEYLGEEEKSQQARLTGANADITGQNLPAQEKAQQLHDKLRDAWINKSAPDWQKFAEQELAAAPGNIARMVRPHLAGIMQLPQTGKGYAITMQDDLPKSVNVYGRELDRKDPNLPPGAAEDFDRAMAAHTTKRNEKLTDESTVAGYAADRQAAGFNNQAASQQRTFTNQQMEEGRRAAAKHLQDYRSAEQQNNLVQELASSKSPTDQTSLAFKALGLDLPEGVHRINETELNAIRNQGGLPDRAYRAILNWTQGQQFAPDILKDIQGTAQKITQSKKATANAGLQDTYRTYGYKDPTADETGAIGAAKPAASGGEAKVLTQAQLQQAAADHKVTIDEARRQAEAQGYRIQ